jgi:hypothetical protein
MRIALRCSRRLVVTLLAVHRLPSDRAQAACPADGTEHLACQSADLAGDRLCELLDLAAVPISAAPEGPLTTSTAVVALFRQLHGDGPGLAQTRVIGDAGELQRQSACRTGKIADSEEQAFCVVGREARHEPFGNPCNAGIRLEASGGQLYRPGS